MQKAKYVAIQDKEVAGFWRVEGQTESGEIYITIFPEPDAEERAIEYLNYKLGTHPALKNATEKIVEKPLDSFKVQTKNGHEITVRPSRLEWNVDVKRKILSARPKRLLDISEEFS